MNNVLIFRFIYSGRHTPSQIKDLLVNDPSNCCSNKGLNKSAVLPSSQKRKATSLAQPSKKTRSSLPGMQKPSTATTSRNGLDPIHQVASNSNAPPPLVMQNHQITQNVLNKPQQYRIPASIKQAAVRPILSKPVQLNRGVMQRSVGVAGPRCATSLAGGATTIRLSSNQISSNQIQNQRRNVSTITATTTNASGPVYHTINGFRIDLNSASKQDNFRLPNGKLIQVKRQMPLAPGVQPNQQPSSVSSTITSATHSYALNQQYIRPSIRQPINQQQIHPQQQIQIIQRNPVPPQQYIIHTPALQPQQNMHHQQGQPTIQYRQIPQLQQSIQEQIPPGVLGQQTISLKPIPTFVKQVYPPTPLGVARTTLQSQLFHTMETCHHLMTKTHTVTNSNAYKTVNNLNDIKELYIHLSYLLTYANGRFKGLQDKCLNEMKALGFTQEAKNLEKGQLAKGELMNILIYCNREFV